MEDTCNRVNDVSLNGNTSSNTKQLFQTRTVSINLNKAGGDANNVLVDIAFASFSDKIVLFISDTSKLSTFFLVAKEKSRETASEVYSTKVLFGSENELYVWFARYLAEKFDTEKPIVVSISLKTFNLELKNSSCEQILTKHKDFFVRITEEVLKLSRSSRS